MVVAKGRPTRTALLPQRPSRSLHFLPFFFIFQRSIPVKSLSADPFFFKFPAPKTGKPPTTRGCSKYGEFFPPSNPAREEERERESSVNSVSAASTVLKCFACQCRTATSSKGPKRKKKEMTMKTRIGCSVERSDFLSFPFPGLYCIVRRDGQGRAPVFDDLSASRSNGEATF